MSAPPPPPELLEELVEEVLLRFPPDNPMSLLRAALVCKLWCRLVSSTAFRRRFREFHRSTPPLLGVIYSGDCELRHEYKEPIAVRAMAKPMTAYFVPTTSFRPEHALGDRYGRQAIDARHGRVLLYRYHPSMHRLGFSVWDPFIDEHVGLPELPFNVLHLHRFAAAVACAATASGNCDHLDCHRQPFVVVVLDIQPHIVQLLVYSSEAGAWIQVADFERPNPSPPNIFQHVHSILVGRVLYFLIQSSNEILTYDLATWEVSTIHLPSNLHCAGFGTIVLITDDDGRLGLVTNTGYRLELWSMVAGGKAGFVLTRLIDLRKVVPSVALIKNSPFVIGFADCGASRFLFMRTSDELYNIEINSIQAKKVANCCVYDNLVFPYVSFCTPTSRA